MFRTNDAELKTTLIQLVTQVSESRQSTSEAIARTREDIGHALKEIRQLEQGFNDIKTQLARGESIAEDVKSLKVKAEAIEDRLTEVSAKVERLDEWKADITQQQKDDARTFRDTIIDYALKAFIFLLLSGAGVLTWRIFEPSHDPPKPPTHPTNS